MKKTIALIFVFSFVGIYTAQTKTIKKTPVKKPAAAQELILTYDSTNTNAMGWASYSFTDANGKRVEFNGLNNKNQHLNKLFESGNVKESMDEANFTVKENIGKKYKIKHKATKGSGQFAMPSDIILSVVEFLPEKAAPAAGN
ncbi:MAG: hypothetical protein IAF38_11440 [Bacteroidia bacterium]|nr:hypothetical protein [Bacteroidia bacterium]